MRIMLAAQHRYPAGGLVEYGRRANPRSSGGAAIVHDLLARGLVELGHEVHYHLDKGFDAPAPKGIHFCARPRRDVDIVHFANSQFLHKAWGVHVAAALGIPWITSCHRDSTGIDHPFFGPIAGKIPANWVAVSQTLARFHRSSRWVHNGIDPDAMIYSESKDDYFLFVGRAQAAEDKGLLVAFELARRVGFKLIVAGGSHDPVAIGRLEERCRDHGARYVGEVRGRRKAELFAGARALLFPTRLNEAFGLVIAEALMSGTPVIASRNGACAELVTPEVGFTCDAIDDYEAAIRQIDTIPPQACRDLAMERYHYLRMARDYVPEYTREIRNPSTRPLGTKRDESARPATSPIKPRIWVEP